MKQTSALRVLEDVRLDDRTVVINPNDGFDIDLMMTTASLQIRYTTALGGEAVSPPGEVDGMVVQKNECTLGTVVVNKKVAKQLGSPQTVKLAIDDGVLTVYPG